MCHAINKSDIITRLIMFQTDLCTGNLIDPNIPCFALMNGYLALHKSVYNRKTGTSVTIYKHIYRFHLRLAFRSNY